MQPLEQHPEDVNPNWGKDDEAEDVPKSWVSKEVFEMLIRTRDDKKRTDRKARYSR
jgi:hypothetical protein